MSKKSLECIDILSACKFKLIFTGIIVAIGISGFYYLKNIENIRIAMTTKVLEKGKKIIIKAEIYYQARDGKMIIHYSYPTEYFFITNSKGEAKFYDPKNNTVYKKQHFMYSSESSYFYYFLSNKMNDMGLKDLGLHLSETKFEDNLLITTWFPKIIGDGKVGKVELVHENYKPIFMAYYDTKGKILRKVYYYQYADFNNISIPLKVTEFSYLPEGDSVITKTNYSDVKINDLSANLDNIIPRDAKNVD